MVLCVNGPGKCTPIDFAAGNEMLLEQMLGNIAVPLEVDDGQRGENLETWHGEILICLKKQREKDIENDANEKYRHYNLVSPCYPY